MRNFSLASCAFCKGAGSTVMAELRLGTSGWQYKHWKGPFYPDELPTRRWLEYYAQQFFTAEVNYSFYRLPSPQTYAKWRSQVPEDFLFALKCSRLITHAKRLGTLADLWTNFINNAAELKDALGPILCQLPEPFEKDISRLDQFLSSAQGAWDQERRLRMAIEFRHESWFCAQVYRLLEKHQVALVIASSSLYPRADRLTTDFAYFRYHGPDRLFDSGYNKKQLQLEASKMYAYLEQGIDVFGYFNNDGHGYACRNALSLKDLLKKSLTKSA